jgi:hypothetical protein
LLADGSAAPEGAGALAGGDVPGDAPELLGNGCSGGVVGSLDVDELPGLIALPPAG